MWKNPRARKYHRATPYQEICHEENESSIILHSLKSLNTFHTLEHTLFTHLHETIVNNT